MAQNVYEDEDLGVLSLSSDGEECLVDCGETWLSRGFVQNEDTDARNQTNGPNRGARPQLSSNKMTGSESKRNARFKTQVIKYEEPLGDIEDIDLEPPPSFPSLDDFLPKTPTEVSAPSIFDTADPVILSHPVKPALKVQTTAVDTPNTAAFKSNIRDRIKAIKMKYATPKPLDVDDDDEINDLCSGFENVERSPAFNRTFEEAPSNKPYILNRTFEEVPRNKTSMLNRTFEEVPSNKTSMLNRTFEEVPSNKPSMLNRTFEEVPSNKTSMLNRTFEEVPSNNPSLLNRTFEEVPRKSLNRTFEDIPTHKPSLLDSTFEKLSVIKTGQLNRSFDEVQRTKSSLINQKSLEEIRTNKLSLLNNNLFVASNSTAENSRSLTNINESVMPRPRLKKQGTFEILDKLEDGDVGSENYNHVQTDEDGDDRYQTMVLPSGDNREMNGTHVREFAFSTPKSIKSTKMSIYKEEQEMNTSFTIEKHEDFSSRNRENTSVTYLNGNSSSPVSSQEEFNMNRSFIVNHNCDAEEREAAINKEFNLNEANMNESFTVVSTSENHYEQHRHEVISHDLNTSFTVEKHYDMSETVSYGETSAHNASDINANIVNGKVIHQRTSGAVANTNSSYRTFTRPKKPSAAVATTNAAGNRNGTSGLQKKSIMKPSAGNLNATYRSDPAPNVNETAVNSNTTYTNQSRFSTITRPKSKLSYGGQTQTRVPPSYATSRLKNSSSSESLKSNESYVISRPHGLPAPTNMQAQRSIYKSTGALNMNGSRLDYGKIRSTENLSSGESGEITNGGSGLSRPASGPARSVTSRIPAPGSRIPSAPSSRISMLPKYGATRRV